MADDMEKQARAAGFKNAAEMRAFYLNRQRMNKRGGDAPGTQGKGQPVSKEKRDSSLLGRIFKPVNDALERN